MQPLWKAFIQLMDICDCLSIQRPPGPLLTLHASTLLHTHKPCQKGTNIPLQKTTGTTQIPHDKHPHGHPAQTRLDVRGEEGAGVLTCVVPRQLQLQLLHLFDQERDVLQQVLVLEQELVHACLGLQPCRCLRGQLVLQQVDLCDRERWVSMWETLLKS